MAIVAVNHVWSGETWDDDLDGPRGYQSLYRVISNDPQESPQAVRAVVPARGTAFPTDARAFARKRSARRLDDTRLVWEVTITYEFRVNDPTESPLDEPPKIRWTSSLERVPIIKDLEGKAILNSAGDYPDPPPERDMVVWTINIQFNLASVPSGIRSFAGAVNEDAISIEGETIAAERARVIGLDISDVQERNEIQFRTVTLVIAAIDDEDTDGFDLSILDQGFRVKEDGELVDILIEDEEGNKARPSSPVLLDGSGGKLTDPSPDTAVFLDFVTTRKKNLTVFPGIV